jgi:hypothetical protein
MKPHDRLQPQANTSGNGNKNTVQKNKAVCKEHRLCLQPSRQNKQKYGSKKQSRMQRTATAAAAAK